MPDLEERLPLDTDNLLSAIIISPVQPGHNPTNIELWTFYICLIWSRTSSDFQLCLAKRPANSVVTSK